VGLEWAPLSLVITIEELLGRNSSGSSLESREYGHGDPLHWPCGTLCPQKLALTSLTSGGRSVGIVRSWTQATEVFFVPYRLCVEKRFVVVVATIIQLCELSLLFVVQSGLNVSGINLHPRQNQCHSHQGSMRADTFTGVSCWCTTCLMPTVVIVTFVVWHTRIKKKRCLYHNLSLYKWIPNYLLDIILSYLCVKNRFKLSEVYKTWSFQGY
jgi:hypothetical protein